MTRDEVIKLAKEAGIPDDNIPSLAWGRLETGAQLLERFATLVAATELEKQRDELNRLCEFNEKTMQFLLDVINHIINEVKLTSSQYELCRQAIANVKGETK